MFDEFDPQIALQDPKMSIPSAEQEGLVRSLDESKKLDLALTGAVFLRDAFRQKRWNIIGDQREFRGRTPKLLPEYRTLFQVCQDYAILTPSEIKLYGEEITEWEARSKR